MCQEEVLATRKAPMCHRQPHVFEAVSSSEVSSPDDSLVGNYLCRVITRPLPSDRIDPTRRQVRITMASPALRPTVHRVVAQGQSEASVPLAM